jgi:hypothetical protein
MPATVTEPVSSPAARASIPPPAPGAAPVGGDLSRRLVGVTLLGLLAAAALVPPEALWAPPGRRIAVLVAGGGTWLPVAVAVAFAGALAGAGLARAGRLPAWGTELAARRRAGLAVAGLSGLAVGAVAALAFGALPVHVDGVVQAFQANVLRGGAAAAPAPPLREFFLTLNTAIADGRWLGQFPPGFPALLALAGHGWGPAVLHALVAAWLAHALYRAGAELYGRMEGLLAAGLVAISPFALILSASGLNHAAAATLAVTAFWLALRVRPHRQRAFLARSVACGLALGGLIATRPLDGLVTAACVVPLALPAAGARRRAAAGLVLGLAPPLALAALYNRAVTGSALEVGYSFVWGAAHGPGFHVSPWGEPHNLARGIFNLHRDLWLLNAGALGRALPLLAMAALPLALSCGRGESFDPGRPNSGARTARAGEDALYALVLGLAAAYVLYWHHDWFLGPRYLFGAFPFLMLLASRGMALTAGRLRGRPLARGALAGALVAGALWLLAVDLPDRVGSAVTLRPEFRVDVAGEAREQGILRGVIFVKESWGSRLLARLRARGLTASEAERVYRRADHCLLEELLGDPATGRARILSSVAADLERAPAPRAEPARNGDPTLRLRPGPLPPACGAEIAYDLAAPYGSFTPQLARQDPWLRGPIVVARDLPGENARLVATLGLGPGWLYVPGRRGGRGAFLPLRPGEGSAF